MDKEKKKPGWLREAMPRVANLIDKRRKAWGDEHVNACLRDGLGGKPNRFYAFEAGYIVGTRFDPSVSPISDADLIRIAALDVGAFMVMEQPAGWVEPSLLKGQMHDGED